VTAFEAGQTVGRYRILRPLGAGAMGEVYLAQDPQIERLLAIKTVRVAGDAPSVAEQAAQIAERTERLLREARTAGRLIHPHIVTLFDAGEEQGTLYLAFEYVEGQSLAERLRGGEPLTVAEALRIAREAAQGLDYAHRRGIVHRDIKPANLLLTADGQLKISDFGIAKMVGQATELTVTGSVVGSPQYLSPEQVRGEELDGRSDLFSLGIVLYEMVGGRRPFEGETFTTLLYKILHEQPAPIRLHPDLAPALVRLLGRLLAKDRDARLPDGAAVAEELAALERDLDPAVLGRAARVEETDGVGDIAPTAILAPGDLEGATPAAPATRPGEVTGQPPATRPPSPRSAPPPPPPAPAPAPSAASAASAVAAPPPSGRRKLWLAAALVLVVLGMGAVAGVLGLRWLRERIPAEAGQVAEADAGAAAGETEADAVPEGDGGWSDSATAADAAQAGATAEEAPRQAGRGGDDERAGPAEPSVPPPGARPTSASKGATPQTAAPPRPAESGMRDEAPGGAAAPAGDGRDGEELSPEARRLETALERRPALRRAARELTAARGAGRSREPVDQTLQTGLRLTFDVEPPGAFVLLDGTVIGRAAELDASEGGVVYTLPGPGEYLIKLRAPGMADYRVLVEAAEGGPARSSISARLEAARGSELELGDLRLVRVQEAVGFAILPPPAERGARILVDGQPAGRAIQFPGRFARGATWLRLDPGRHRVSIVAPGFVRQDVAVDVSAGATERRQRIEVRLEPEG